MALGGVGVLGFAWLRLGCIPARANGKWQMANSERLTNGMDCTALALFLSSSRKRNDA